MEQELKLLKQVAIDIEFLKEKVETIAASLEEIDEDLHEVRPEYLEKLAKIEKGKFITKQELEKELE